MEEEVIGYIKSARGHGMSDSEIKQNLLNAGWDAETVESSYAHVKAMDNQEGAPARPQDVHAPSHIGQPIRASEVLNSTSQNYASPSGSLSENSFTTDSPTPFYKKPLLWILVFVFMVVLGGAGYWYTAYGFSTPQGIWKKFRKLTQSKIYSNKFTFNYQDPGEFSSQEFEGFSLKDINLGFDGTTYMDVRDEKNPQSSAEVNYTFGSNSTKVSTGFQYRIKDRVLYLNVGENLFLDNVFKSLGQGKKIDWLKLDLNALEDEMNKSGSGIDQEKIDKIFTTQARNDIAKIWEDATFVKVEKYMGRETVDNVNTVHFTNTLDKQAIKDALNSTLDKIVASGNSTVTEESRKLPEKDVVLAKMVINGLVDKLEIKNFETWIGVRDFRLYKVKFESNAPSVISAANILVNDTLGSAKEKARDAKRLADVRQMATVMELYYNDMNGYPAGKNGVPEGVTPTYIGMIPSAPTPADGTCTDYYNSYWYEPKGKKIISAGKTLYSDYELTFCLGSQVGGYDAGIGKLTPTGIIPNIPCPTSQEKCVSTNQAQAEPEKTDEEAVQDFINKMSFTAKIQVDTTYSNYDKAQNVDIPANSLDVLDLINSQAPGVVQGIFIKASDAATKK